jgi:hypothetical protein
MSHDGTYHPQIYWIELYWSEFYWIEPGLSPRMRGRSNSWDESLLPIANVLLKIASQNSPKRRNCGFLGLEVPTARTNLEQTHQRMKATSGAWQRY